MYKKILIVSILLVLILTGVYREFGVKNMDRILNKYEVESIGKFRYIIVKLHGNSWLDENIHNKRLGSDEISVANDMIEYLKQYRIKRISRNQYYEKTDYEKFVWISINSNNSLIMEISDNTIYSNGKYYKIINEPVDFLWFEEYVRINSKSREF